ncbi:hypothetical protein IIE26_19745 [Cytobacillus oceanisediminis]|uniref:hypothetical protein n=1 Tax=Cytobacillus oceanisediminis TaxID=665099 RepID=UPI001863A41C|nr:hypothetical protein [Cytobacillus oceanisediminis]QOK25892.1 hypothetical protein IIE26_19745 [Cytobacillus oceanisediminis]
MEKESAINAKQVVVKFNKEVDVTTAETTSNYAFSEITGSAIGAAPTAAKVQADGKSVVLTLAAPITAETTFTTTVNGVKVKGTDYSFFPQFAVATKYKDEVKANIADVTSITNGTASTSLTIKFSEPVAAATFKVDGTVASNVSWAADRYSVTLSGLSLDASKSHTVDALNVTDFANNVNSLETKTFSVAKDVAAPNVTLSANSDNQLVLTFDKAMNPATVNATNVKVKDELLDDLVVSGFTAVDSTNKKFTVDLPAGLYTNKDSRKLTVLLNDSLQDSLGNKLVTQFQNVTIAKDTTNPTVSNVAFVKNPSTGNVAKLVVNFSEGLAAAGSGLATSGIKVIDPNGADVTASFFAANSAVVAKGDTKVEIPVTATVNSGKYTFYFPTGFATDIAQTPNTSVATSKVVDFGSASSSDFKIVQSAIGQTPSNTTNVITVNFGRAVKGGAQAGSATDVANYTLNGAPLPEGTLITLNSPGYTTATITLPDETVAKSDTAAVLGITGVQDTTGKVIVPFIGTTQVTDSKAPVLSTAVLNGNGTFTAGFGETLATSAVLGDFDVTINGKAVAASEINLTPAVGGEAGKYVFSVNGLVEDPDSTPSNGDEFLYIDVDGDGAYVAANDIKVTGATPTAGVVDLNSAAITSVKLSTKAAGPLTGADAAGNTLKLNVVKTVK